MWLAQNHVQLLYFNVLYVKSGPQEKPLLFKVFASRYKMGPWTCLNCSTWWIYSKAVQESWQQKQFCRIELAYSLSLLKLTLPINIAIHKQWDKIWKKWLGTACNLLNSKHLHKLTLLPNCIINCVICMICIISCVICLNEFSVSVKSLLNTFHISTLISIFYSDLQHRLKAQTS